MNSADNATAEARFAQGTRPVARRKFLVSSGAATLGLGLIMQPHRMMAADPAVPGSGQQWKIKMKVITFRDTATAATPAEQAQDGETKVFNNPVLAPITNTLPAAPVVPAIPTPTNPVDLNAPVQTTTTWIIVKNGAAPTRTRYTVNRQERTVQGGYICSSDHRCDL